MSEKNIDVDFLGLLTLGQSIQIGTSDINDRNKI